jgi:hypothetical protein
MNKPVNRETDEPEVAAPCSCGRCGRVLRWTGTAAVILLLLIAYLVQDHVRTLRSLRRIPGTNAYVIDYYADYNIDQIRSQGMDVDNVEDGLIRVFFPDVLVPIAATLKGRFIDSEVETFPAGGHRCSTVVWRSGAGDVLFGRNFDWKHDACLIVKVHKDGGVSSIAVIDLHYLNLDRDDLENTNLFQRVPLLFAPYYLQDGMNRYGVAVSDMSVDDVKSPYDPAKPNVLHSTAMRLILDDAKSTAEAIALLEQYNIHFAETTGHLMIADGAGRSAVVEFIDGAIVATPGGENWQVCTNHRIAGKAEEENDGACGRYRAASERLASLPSAAGAADVMKIMQAVVQEKWTMWTSVYNLSTGEFRLAYRRHFDAPYDDRLALAN